MKKLDLHIHSVQAASDHPFFSVEKLKEYVQTLTIEGIAITNHNMFDLEQSFTSKNHALFQMLFS